MFAVSDTRPPARDASQRLLRVLLALGGLVLVLHVAALMLCAWGTIPVWVMNYVHLDCEANVPTWYSSGLLSGCALGAAGLALMGPRGSGAGRARAERVFCRLLAGLFLLLSLDETAQIHELFESGYRVLGLAHHWYVYVAPVAVPALVVLACVAWRTLRDRARLRRGLLTGFAFFFAGSLGLESVSGLFHPGAPLERHTWLYQVELVSEEGLEMLGSSLLLCSLLRELLERRAEREQISGRGEAGVQARAHEVSEGFRAAA